MIIPSFILHKNFQGFLLSPPRGHWVGGGGKEPLILIAQSYNVLLLEIMNSVSLGQWKWCLCKLRAQVRGKDWDTGSWLYSIRHSIRVLPPWIVLTLRLHLGRFTQQCVYYDSVLGCWLILLQLAEIWWIWVIIAYFGNETRMQDF